MVDIDTLKDKCIDFEKQEGRASFYDIASSIVEKYPLQACVIILATWNVSRFRFIVSDSKNLEDLMKAMEECKPLFDRLKNERFETTDFSKTGETIKAIYSILSKVKGVEYTGGSKVMHLLNNRLFVMWDKYIRDEYEICGTDAEGYLCFLIKMQDKFKGIDWRENNKTIAKAIDEYNYVMYSLPAVRVMKQRQKEKRAQGEANAD